MSTKSLKNKIAKKAEEPKGPTMAMQITHAIEAQSDQFARVLPKGMEPDRLARIALTEMRNNEKLEQCHKESILGALMTSAQLGLEPGVLGQCHLVPFYNKKNSRYECQLIVGYRGLIDLSYRSGMVANIDARPVLESDDFGFTYGLNQELWHRPKPPKEGDNEEPIAYYALVELTNGGKHFHVMYRQQVLNHMGKYAQGFDRKSSPWQTDFDAMAMKTCIRQMEAFMPKSIEMQQAFAYDGVVRETTPMTGQIEPVITTERHELAAMAEDGDGTAVVHDSDGVIVEVEVEVEQSPAEQVEAMTEAELAEEPFEGVGEPEGDPEGGEAEPEEASPDPEDDDEADTFPAEGSGEPVVDQEEADKVDGTVEEQGSLAELEQMLAGCNKKDLLVFANQQGIKIGETWSAAKMRNEIASVMIEQKRVAT